MDLEEETRKFKTLDPLQSIETEIPVVGEITVSKSMENDKPLSDVGVSDRIPGDSSGTQSNVISSEEVNPILEITEIENQSSDFVQFNETLIGSSSIDESQCSKPLVELENGKKFDDIESSKAETLDESVKEGDKKLEDSQIKKIIDDSVDEEGEDEELTKTLTELSAVAIEGDEIGKFNCTDLLNDLENRNGFGDNSESGIGEEELSLVPGPWSEGHRNQCDCAHCLEAEQEEWSWRNNGLGWPSSSSRMFQPKRHCRRRGFNFRREKEAEMYDYMGGYNARLNCLNIGYYEPEPCPVGAGLANLGNTCFLNAIMQCFTHTVPLVEGLLSLKHKASSHGADEFCVLCAVCDQIEYSLVNSGRVISPSNLVDNLSHISSYFRRYQQEDAHEFLQCLLDKLDYNWSKYETSDNDSLWSDDTLVKQIFGGRLVSQIRCCSCGHHSVTYEPLIDLSLEIEDTDSIEGALKSFTKVESIEVTENFLCDNCKEKVKVEKQLILDQAPSVVGLHLKRFKSDGIYVEKIDKKVEFPLELDLGPYTKGSNDGHEDLKYELFAVVVHVGFSSTSGHYFCYIRTSPEKWYRFDDSKVTMVEEETVLDQHAYILFYVRKGTPWFDSLIENWKAECHKKILSTSPKSVLVDTDLQSSSFPARTSFLGGDGINTGDSGFEVQNKPGVGIGLHSCEAAEMRDATWDASVAPTTELEQDEVEVKAGLDAWDAAGANQAYVSSSSVPERNSLEDKGDGVKEIDANEDQNCKEIGKIEQISCGGTCSPSLVKNTFDGEPQNEASISPSTPPRALSPDIYSDTEPTGEAYCIPTSHLKIKDKPSSAKKSVNTLKQDMKRKEAAKYIRRSMPGGRGHMFMAAMSGSKSDSIMSKKRRKHASLLHGRQSPKKRVKVSPKRVLRPVTA